MSIDIIEVCKNKNSGNYFVYINDIGTNEALFVTPNAQIKILQTSSFDDIEEYEETYLLQTKLLTAEQINKFNGFMDKRFEDSIDDILESDRFDRLSPSEQDGVIKTIRGMMKKNEGKI